MKTKLHSACDIRYSAFTAVGTALVAAITLFTTTPRAPAQTNWGNALSFDGVDDYVILPSGAWFIGNFTIETWVYERTYNNYSRVIDFGTGTANNVILVLSADTSGKAVLDIVDGTSHNKVTTPAAIPLNQWVHLAATLRGSSGTLYVNGVAVATNTAMPAPGAVNRTNNYIGRSNWGNEAYANAIFDDLRIWDVARTTEEIREGMCHPLTGTEPNLVVYYRFDEEAGTTAHDAATDHRDGTLVNGPAWTNSTIPPFLNINAGLPGVARGSVAWGDYDNDGRLDILLTGMSNAVWIAQVWRNTGSTFVNMTATVAPGLPEVVWSSVAWGDYDNDGRLDILLTGHSDTGDVAQVWRNTGTGFTNIQAGLPGVSYGSVGWGDYDNDGRLDILLTGDSASGRIAQVWRNTGSGFVNSDVGLPGVDAGSVAWGDYDNDGRLDILLTGTTNGDSSGAIAQVWKNTCSGFVKINAGLPGVSYHSSVAWGDYDNDGRLDILLTGSSASGQIAQVWRNTGSGFVNVTATVAPELPGANSSSVAWGDYDNDGRLDILLTGSASGFTAQVWRNTGTTFTNMNAGLPGVVDSSAGWGDYDNDGRLDILLTGDDSSQKPIAQVWRNIGWTTNTPPAPPAALAAAGAGSAVTLSWHAASDPETPAPGLTYNLRVGTTPGGSDIVGPHASAAGTRRLTALGNAQQSLRVPLTSPRTGRIYWSVQAVDSALAGSAFSAESSFTLWPVLGPESGLVPGDTSGDGMVGREEFAAVRQSFWQSQPLQLGSLSALGSGTFGCAVTNCGGAPFTVLASSNLVDWVELPALAVPSYQWWDPNAIHYPHRFYRLRWP